ncbi:MAG: hypothetical protein ACFFBY_06385, partial [Promethearchaeota archaeon]
RKEIVHAVKKEILEKPSVPPKAEKVEPIVQKPKILEEPQKEVPITGAKSLLSKQFDLIRDGLETMTGLELSKALEKFQTEYINKEGYNSVLKNINNTSNDIRGKTYVLSQSEKDDLKMKMQFWKQKLNL